MLQTDFCRLVFKDGSTLDFLCVELGIGAWPPPKFLNLHGYNFERESCSALSEGAARIAQCVRGALYKNIPVSNIIT